MAYLATEIQRQPHHEKGNICSTRPKYREGRKDTAVKVYTINQESYFLIIQNVPSVGAVEELKALCEQYGFVESIHPLDDYPSDEFTEAYLVKYTNFFAARTAKKHLDDRSFFGGVLHVCYAPEFEMVEDTKRKLIERRKFIATKTRSVQQNEGNSSIDFKPYQKRKDYDKTTDDTYNLKKPKSDSQCMTYIWAGKEYNVPVASAKDIQEKNLELQAEIAIRHEQQKQNFEIQTQKDDELQHFVQDVKQKKESQQFVPRQLSHTKGQNFSRMKVLEPSKISSQSIVQESEKCDSNVLTYSYDETMNEIRKKLSSFTSANLSVNL